MRPEANESPPPTRSKISSESRCVARTRPDVGDHAIAPQSLTVAERTVLNVVAMTLKFG